MSDTPKSSNLMSRRSFLKGSATATMAAVMGPSLLLHADKNLHLPATAPNLSVPPQFTLIPPESTHLITATHWGAFQAEVNDGKFIRAKPFADDFPIPMLEALSDRVYSNSRIKYPMVRKSFLEKGAKADPNLRGKEPFVRVSWKEALDLVASELKRVKKEYGNESIFAGSVDWHSVGKLHNSPVLIRRLLALHGGFTDDSGDFSVQAAMTILPHVTGNIEVYDQQTAWPTILGNTDLIVMFGAALLKNNQIGWTPPDHYTYGALKEVKAKGIETVMIDPRRNDTAKYLDSTWLPIRPNTDVALMLGIAHTLYTNNLHDEEFLAKYTVGFDKFADYLTGKSDGQPKSAEWAAKITEIDAAAITDLAKKMAAGRTLLISGWSVQRQDHGEQAPWMVVTLAAMLGQVGLPGGGFGFSYHYASGGSPAADAPSVPGISSGENPTGIDIPYARALTDLLLHPGKVVDFNGEKITYPDIELVYWAGGNPFSHQMDRNLQIQAWKRAETTIIHDMYWTNTAKFADIVLPVTTTLERNDVDTLSEYTSEYIVAMHQIIEPLYEARSDYDIFVDIAERLGFKDAYTEGKSEMQWIQSFYEEAKKQADATGAKMPDFETFWSAGFVKFPISKEAEAFVRYGDFREDPLSNPLGTPSGKIEIYSKTIEGFGYDDCPPHPTWLEPVEWLGSKRVHKYPLHLVSPHPRYRLHSQLDNTWIRGWYEVNEREPIWLNPEDAKTFGIADGDIVRVFNDRGELLAGALETDRIRSGVACLHEGAWYDPDKPGEVGALCKHGNVNLVTMDKGTSKLAQGNVANTVLIAVEKYDGPPMKVTAFDPPPSE